MTFLFFISVNAIETQVKQHAGVKHVNYCHSITITTCPSVVDCSGSGSTTTTALLDSLFPELLMAFPFSHRYSTNNRYLQSKLYQLAITKQSTKFLHDM